MSSRTSALNFSLRSPSLRLPNGAGDDVALAQAVLADLGERDVDVVRARQVAGGADEGVVVEDVEDAGHREQDVVLGDHRLRPRRRSGPDAHGRHGRGCGHGRGAVDARRARRPRRSSGSGRPAGFAGRPAGSGRPGSAGHPAGSAGRPAGLPPWFCWPRERCSPRPPRSRVRGAASPAASAPPSALGALSAGASAAAGTVPSEVSPDGDRRVPPPSDRASGPDALAAPPDCAV